jgi:hypothetical protein
MNTTLHDRGEEHRGMTVSMLEKFVRGRQEVLGRGSPRGHARALLDDVHGELGAAVTVLVDVVDPVRREPGRFWDVSWNDQWDIQL